MWTLSATVKTDLKPIPFSPTYACMRVSSGGQRGYGCAGRTNEPAWATFTRFGARADVAYGPDVGSRKAKLVAFEYDDTVLDAKAQCWGGTASVRVVIRVLYELE